MGRFELVEFDEATESMQATYAEFLRTTNSFKLPIWLMSMGSSPRLASGYWSFVKSILIEGELPMVLKEMVIFMVSVTNGSPYCSTAHAHAILSLDQSLTFEDLVRLTADMDSVELPAATRSALKFAVAMAKNPRNVDNERLQGLREIGFSEVQTKELIGVIVLAEMFNVYAISMNLPIEAGYREFPLPSAE